MHKSVLPVDLQRIFRDFDWDKLKGYNWDSPRCTYRTDTNLTDLLGVPCERRVVLKESEVIGENFFIYLSDTDKKDISIRKVEDHLVIRLAENTISAVDENGKEVKFPTIPQYTFAVPLRKNTNKDSITAKMEKGLLTITTRVDEQAKDKLIAID